MSKQNAVRFPHRIPRWRGKKSQATSRRKARPLLDKQVDVTKFDKDEILLSRHQYDDRGSA